MAAPCAALPRPAGRPAPSVGILMSQAASSSGVIDLPRLGASASAALPASTSAMRPVAALRVNMPDLPLGVDAPAGDRIEVLVREGEHRRRFLELAALGDELGAGRLHA